MQPIKMTLGLNLLAVKAIHLAYFTEFLFQCDRNCKIQVSVKHRIPQDIRTKVNIHSSDSLGNVQISGLPYITWQC